MRYWIERESHAKEIRKVTLNTMNFIKFVSVSRDETFFALRLLIYWSNLALFLTLMLNLKHFIAAYYGEGQLMPIIVLK